jgi:hypothetical protein
VGTRLRDGGTLLTGYLVLRDLFSTHRNRGLQVESSTNIEHGGIVERVVLRALGCGIRPLCTEKSAFS